MLGKAHIRRWARPVLFSAMLPLGGLAFYAPLSLCEIAAEWAAERGSANVSFGEVAALPLQFQRALLDVLPESDRVRLWTEHLNSFLADPAELTDAQRRTRSLLSRDLSLAERTLLLEVRADLPRLTSTSIPTGQRFLAFTRLQARANLIFGNRMDFDRITARIGTDLSVVDRDAVIAELQSAIMHPGQAELRALSWRMRTVLTPPPDCNCNGLQSCEGSGELCLQTQPPCAEAPCGGTIGAGICTGGVCRKAD